MIVQDFRPDWIIKGYWREVIDINEEDILLDVEFLIKELTHLKANDSFATKENQNMFKRKQQTYATLALGPDKVGIDRHNEYVKAANRVGMKFSPWVIAILESHIKSLKTAKEGTVCEKPTDTAQPTENI